MARRSVLFSPGDDGQKLQRAVESGADVVVFDLEDGVAPDDRVAARETVSEALAAVQPTDCEVAVRVNPVGAGAAVDIETALADTPPDSVALPKTDDAADVEALTALLTDAGHDLPILALVESAAGVLHAEAIAAADPTDALIFGAEDLAADIGATRTDEGWEVSHARQQVVLAARAAGITPIDTLHTDFRDADGLRADTERAVTMGFGGKLAIHPAQVPVINEVFRPDADAIAWAKRVLEAAADAEGGVFAVEGEMIDAPLVAQAERILARADEGD